MLKQATLFTPAITASTLLIPLFVTGLFSSLGFAQEQIVRQKGGLDFVSQQLAEQMLNQTKALSNPELVNAQANYFRAMYLALIESGFTQDEALKITVAMASKHD